MTRREAHAEHCTRRALISTAAKNLVRGDVPEELRLCDPQQEIAEGASWLSRYLEGSGQRCFVVGLSGGLDSATVALWAAQAVGEDRLRMVALPYGLDSRESSILDASSDASVENAALVADMIPGATFEVIDITESVDAVLRAARLARPGSSEARSTSWRIACANAKAMVRAAILRTITNAVQGLLLGTENKTENLLGYFTKGGDEQSDLEVLTGFFKTQVWQLARELNVPDAILNKAPTADLWSGQTDEGELGFTYIEADLVLSYADEDMTPADALATIRKSNGSWKADDGCPDCSSIIDRVLRHRNATRFKRQAKPALARTRPSMLWSYSALPSAGGTGTPDVRAIMAPRQRLENSVPDLPPRIAVAQTFPMPGNVTANVEEHLNLARRAASEGVGVVIFPELSLTGYEVAVAAQLAFTDDDARLGPLTDLAAECRLHLVVGAPVRISERLHVGAFILGPDRSIRVYTKNRLGAFGPEAAVDGEVPPAESTVFTPREQNPVLRVGEWTAALAICAETGVPLHAARAASAGVQAYLASMFVIPSDFGRDATRMRAYAERHAMLVGLANFGAPSGGMAAAGRSSIWSERGHLLCRLGASGSGLAVAVHERGAWYGYVVPAREISAPQVSGGYPQAGPRSL